MESFYCNLDRREQRDKLDGYLALPVTVVEDIHQQPNQGTACPSSSPLLVTQITDFNRLDRSGNRLQLLDRTEPPSELELFAGAIVRDRLHSLRNQNYLKPQRQIPQGSHCQD